MAENKNEEAKIDARLDELANKFANGKDNKDFTVFMEVLENSNVLVPAEMPDNITDSIREAARTGQAMPIDKDNQPKICLLAKNDGSKVFPIFTSRVQIPQEKIPPAIMNIPFSAVIGMLKANQDQIHEIAVNPFTNGFVLNQNLIDLVDRRYKAGANKKTQGTPVQLTEQQFHALAHVKMSRELLPARIFADPGNVMSDLRLQKEKYIMATYKEAYPANIRVPYREEDIAIMSLQIEDDLMITRIDLPEKNTQEGSPLRIYITEEPYKVNYFLIEKGSKETPAMIAKVGADGSHIKLEEAPDNGAEIEAVMGLLKPS